MKKLVLLLMLVCPMMANARKDLCPMLVDGKTWVYDYHHFELKEKLTGEEELSDMYNKTQWEVEYTLRGDTVIEGRQYKKMYRKDTNTRKEYYYGAFREDEKGRVWQFNYEGDNQDFMICDVTLNELIMEKIMPINDVVNVNRVMLQRYHWNGLIGVEGVGLKDKGLVHYLYEPEPDCICDYETFSYVEGDDLSFTNANFKAPSYIELTDEEEACVEKNNDFAFRLFNKIRTYESNVISPLSITYALGMLNNGAVGQTQQEIYNVLGFDNAEAQNAFCLKMINQLSTAGWADETTKALIANTIFVNQGLGIQLQYDFTHAANQYYYAYPQARDFNDGETRGVINKWASDKTNQMIEEILSESDFDPSAVSYLLNAIYFKGMWMFPFDVANTQEESFNGTVSVPMMHQEDMNVGYKENDLYQAVSLPFGNGTYNLQVFLPREGKTLDNLLQNLNSTNWQMNNDVYSNNVIDLKLPRFEISTDQRLEKVMAELGMPSAFSSQSADFSKMCNTQTYIGLMKQMAKIKLDEQGTESAAVTVIGVSTGFPHEATFHANRPFLYVISEQSTGIILFMGQYTDDKPSAIEIPIAEMKNEKYDDGIYDLQGRKLLKAPQKGLYIQNGKKVTVN